MTLLLTLPGMITVTQIDPGAPPPVRKARHDIMVRLRGPDGALLAEHGFRRYYTPEFPGEFLPEVYGWVLVEIRALFHGRKTPVRVRIRKPPKEAAAIERWIRSRLPQELGMPVVMVSGDATRADVVVETRYRRTLVR